MKFIDWHSCNITCLPVFFAYPPHCNRAYPKMRVKEHIAWRKDTNTAVHKRLFREIA